VQFALRLGRPAEKAAPRRVALGWAPEPPDLERAPPGASNSCVTWSPAEASLRRQLAWRPWRQTVLAGGVDVGVAQALSHDLDVAHLTEAVGREGVAPSDGVPPIKSRTSRTRILASGLLQ